MNQLELAAMEHLLNEVEWHKLLPINPGIKNFLNVCISWTEQIFTCEGILETVNHSAKGFRVQSQDNGLSCKDRLCSSLAPIKAFFATIDISLPSNRNSRSEGSGAIRSLVKALQVKI